MSQHHQEKVESQIAKLAGEFLSQEAGPHSLITVTNVLFNEKTKRAMICITVMPESQENSALAFVKRKSSDFREYVRANSRIGILPVFDFVIDIGEKNRRFIEEVSAQDKSDQ